ncbi:MAG: nitroreductase [Bacteroidales bacterium]|nr:nitroreductase [Bacteroidales bacterium]
MNETIQHIISRRSVKKYTSAPVDEALVAEVAKAGTYAPTGMNMQSPIIIAVTNKALRDRLSEINRAILGTDHDPFYGAPVVLVVLAKKSVGTCIYDGSLVMQNMMLAAHSLGLGSCWIHRAKQTFESEDGRQILADLGIDASQYEGIGNCIIGHAAEGALKPQAPRKENYIIWAK